MLTFTSNHFVIFNSFLLNSSSNFSDFILSFEYAINFNYIRGHAQRETVCNNVKDTQPNQTLSKNVENGSHFDIYVSWPK